MGLFDLIRGCYGRRRGPTPQAPAQTLLIDVKVSGDINRPQAVYSLAASNVGVDSARHVVSSTGNINLSELPVNLAFDSRTEITFQLCGSVRCRGADHPVRFRRPVLVAFRIRGADGRRPTPGQFFAFFPNPLDTTRLTVDDQNNDGREYLYCLRITAEGCRGYWGKLDPSIINRWH